MRSLQRIADLGEHRAQLRAEALNRRNDDNGLAISAYSTDVTPSSLARNRFRIWPP